MLCFTCRKTKKIHCSKKEVILALSYFFLFNLFSPTQAQDFLILCNNTNSKEYSKLALSDEGTYFLFQGLNSEMEWEQISYFPDLFIIRDAQIGYKSEKSWDCQLGTCFRNEYFSFNRDTLNYSKSIKSESYTTEEKLFSDQCLFDFPNA